MAVTVVIENAVLYGVADDMSVQRVATVFVSGECYRVVAPAMLKGATLDFIDHFSVRQPSNDALDFGAELLVTGQRRDFVVRAVAEELLRKKRDDGRIVGRTPDGLHYDASICLRGHVKSYAGTPFTPGEHCSKCGDACIDECQNPDCHEPIRGILVDTSFVGYKPPNYCHACGRAYPWMQDRLATAKDLLDHDTKLTLGDREKLWSLLQYVMSDPKSDLAPGKRKLIDIDLEGAKDVTKDFITTLLAKTFAEVAKG